MQTPRVKLRQVLALTEPAEGVRVKGWARTIRQSKNVTFVEPNGGSSLDSLQVVIDATMPGYAELGHITTGSALEVYGDLAASPAKEKALELRAREVTVLGLADPSFPLQKKRHSFEYLREIAHLRAR